MSALKTAHTYSGDRKKTCVSEAGCLGQEQWGRMELKNRDKTDLKAKCTKVRRGVFLLGE